METGSNRGKTDKTLTQGYTYINLGNPSLYSVIIDHMEISLGADVAAQDVKFGVFYPVSSVKYRCRHMVTLTLSGKKGNVLVFEAPDDFDAFTGQPGDVVGTYTQNGYTSCVGRSADDSGGGFRWYHGDATDGGEYDFSGVDVSEDISVMMKGYTKSNIWKASLSYQPDKVWFDAVPGTYHSSMDYLDTPRDWYWSSDALYIFSEKNPGELYSSVIAETVNSICPVLTYGDTPIDTDTGNLLRWVMKENNRYVMYTENYSDEVWHIKKKYSGDGITWGPVGDALLNPGGTGAFDENGQADPTVIKDAENDYKMWYDALSGINVWTIGYATSTDSDLWTHQGKVLGLSENGWDSRGIHHPVVIKYEGTYYMYYSGWDSSPGWSLGLAVSHDGSLWEKYEENPVLYSGDEGAFDDNKIRPSKPFMIEDTWYMLYWADDGSGFDNLPKDYVGLAVSTDLYNWTKKGQVYPQNSVFGNVSFQANCSIIEGNRIRLWYSGLTSGYQTYYGEIDSNDYTEVLHESSYTKQVKLSQNYPNPFNPSTSIKFFIPDDESKHVYLKVYDVRGALVKTLVDRIAEPGVHSIIWDGTDTNDIKVSSGIYIYRLQEGKFTKSEKMMLIR
ncbi:MAG: T9SS type A sorting domain-containing protein [Candidatus Latescibacteria bacterium]|nr:T9SS type A sorting domain-containing protein [Candidatus Latescibacterota bacterium]